MTVNTFIAMVNINYFMQVGYDMTARAADKVFKNAGKWYLIYL